MIDLHQIRSIKEPQVLILGNHEGIVQSILDFDYLAGKASPSILAITGTQQRFFRYYYGAKEILIPGFVSLDEVDDHITDRVDFFAIAQSGRRVLVEAEHALRILKHAQGGMIFAESVPEQHALALRSKADACGKFLIGPASVGMTVGGRFKLGAIAGTLPEQIVQSGTLTPGSVAIVSTSGGMINELISMVSRTGRSISFAAAIGGERFPITKAHELINQALRDEATQSILYFGELGGTDEYGIVDILTKDHNNKPVIAYIAGTVAEKFEAAPQFGHAKAMAKNKTETATEKKKALRESGVIVANTFSELEKLIETLPVTKQTAHGDYSIENRLQNLQNRQSKALFINRVSADKGGEVKVLDQPLIEYIDNKSLSEVALGMFLRRHTCSRNLVDFFDLSLKLLVDHGPQVSGAVNTMITARAGKDLPSALAAGLLTIGPRFGGAINQAAENWLNAVETGMSADVFVENFAKKKEYIPGIGHKKYRIDNPDPRVLALLDKFKGGRHVEFAKQVAQITTSKKGQLILNVDGVVAALLIDILIDDEKMTVSEVNKVISSGFCNAIFIYARSVGFIAHYLEQRRLDEGLFRLPDDMVID